MGRAAAGEVSRNLIGAGLAADTPVPVAKAIGDRDPASLPIGDAAEVRPAGRAIDGVRGAAIATAAI